jgi:4-amino-4-deoxy-L-arabinose transferase-like glycosyltransferase
VLSFKRSAKLGLGSRSSESDATLNQNLRYTLQFAAILFALELSYFVSGYLFWLEHNVLNFDWAASYVFFPSPYYVGFWIIAFLCFCSIPLVVSTRLPPKLNERFIVLLLFVASVVIAISLWSVPEINPDAVLWNYQARYVAENSIVSFLAGFGSVVTSSSGLPVPSLMFGIAYTLFGIHRYVIQALNSTLFGLITVLAYFVGKNVFDDERIGTYSGICFLSSPFILSQVPLMLVDVASSFFIVLGIYCFTVLVKTRKILWGAMSAVPFALALLSKLTSAFVLVPVMIVIFAVGLLRSKQRRMVGRNLGVFFLLLVAAGLASLSYYARIASMFYQADPFSVAISSVLHPVMLQYPSILERAVLKSLVLSVTIPLFVISLAGLLIGLYRHDKKQLGGIIVLIVWIVIPTLLVFDPGTLNSAARWIMPTYPAYAIAGATLVAKIKDKQFRRMVLVAILIFSVTSAHVMYAYAWDQSVSRNLMYATDFLQQNTNANSSIRVCGDAAGWMSIYDPNIKPSGSPFDLGSYSFFHCVNPNQTLPQYLVLVRGECCSGTYSLYPTMSPAELDFLKAHYTLLKVFQGGDMQGPWVNMEVEVYALK